jgi:O-antigen chain-terminating methyltransferase
MTNHKSLREQIASVPVLGYFGRVLSNIIRLPKRNAAILEELGTLQQAVTAAQEGSKEQLKQAEALYSDINTQLAAIQLNQDNLKQQIALLGDVPTQAAVSSGNSSDALFADDHVLDRFYIDFEDKFRGSEELISKRLEEYLPLFSFSSY